MTVQKLGTVVNLVLLTLISYVNAHLITTVIDQNLAFGSRPKPSITPIAEAPTAVQTEKDFAPILERNIFGAATENQAEGATPDIDPNAAQHTALNLCLVGTVVSSQADHSFASIQDLDAPNKDVNLFFVGGMIKPDVKLVKVDRQVVYFERLGFLEKLVLCEDGKPRPVDAQPQTSYSPPTPSLSSPAAPPVQVSPGQFRLDRNTVNDHLSNLSTLLTQARVVPHFDKGKPDGFRIFSIRPDSLFDQIGLKNGDVLRKINGLNITTTEEALQAFTQLKNASRLSLDLERDGSAQSFNYDIR